MNKKFIFKTNALSLIEILVVILIISVLTAVALPYYQNAVQSARTNEAVIRWNQAKRLVAGQSLTPAHIERIENEINTKNQLKYFTLSLVCVPKSISMPCWEAEFRLKQSSQRIRYYLATQNNLAQLLCVPQNAAGEHFCESLSGADMGPDARYKTNLAYIIH